MLVFVTHTVNKPCFIHLLIKLICYALNVILNINIFGALLKKKKKKKGVNFSKTLHTAVVHTRYNITLSLLQTSGKICYSLG